MNDLTEADQEALLRIRRAGAEGVRLGEIPVSAAIRLQLFGFAEIRTIDGWQRAYVTRQGASAARQGWAA